MHSIHVNFASNNNCKFILWKYFQTEALYVGKQIAPQKSIYKYQGNYAQYQHNDQVRSTI